MYLKQNCVTTYRTRYTLSNFCSSWSMFFSTSSMQDLQEIRTSIYISYDTLIVLRVWSAVLITRTRLATATSGRSRIHDNRLYIMARMARVIFSRQSRWKCIAKARKSHRNFGVSRKHSSNSIKGFILYYSFSQIYGCSFVRCTVVPECRAHDIFHETARRSANPARLITAMRQSRRNRRVSHYAVKRQPPSTAVSQPELDTHYSCVHCALQMQEQDCQRMYVRVPWRSARSMYL